MRALTDDHRRKMNTPHYSEQRTTDGKNKDSYFSEIYITLDTFHKLSTSNINNGEFHWHLTGNGENKQHPMILTTLENIVEIQICSFSMPIIPEVTYLLIPPPPAITLADTLTLIQNNSNVTPLPPLLVPNSYPYGQYPYEYLPVSSTTIYPWISNPYSQLPYDGLFTIYITETGSQCYKSSTGKRHNYSFVANKSANLHNSLQAAPANGSDWDIFTFTTPIKEMHNMTLIFRNPDNNIKFLPDVYKLAPINIDSSVAPGGPFLRINIPGHQLLMGDRIIISKAKSNNVVLDTYLNRPEGHVVAGDPGLAALNPSEPIPGDYLWTDPAIGIYNLTSPIPTFPIRASIYVAKRRMLIPIKIRQILQRNTN